MSDPTERNGSGLLEDMKTLQYWLWVVPMAIVFAGLVMTLKAVGAPIWLAVVAGIALDEASEPWMQWLIDWREAQKEVSEA